MSRKAGVRAGVYPTQRGAGGAAATWRRALRGPTPWARAGALGLMVLILQVACATRAPSSGHVVAGGHRDQPLTESKGQETRQEMPQLDPVVVIAVDVLEPGTV